ncbi:DUF416 family protein [Flagellimonas iocasae]|uniref:DUF416 family protein n=1 Tax=Flagellimonas iocasae TaxID=2055905 RepID=A0ABW4XW69_9FLAO
MNYAEFETKFKKQVFSIDFDKQLALAIEVCKKLYFDYVEFSEKYQWGDKDILMDAIAILEQSKNKDVNKSEIDQMLNQIDDVTPDMDDFGSDEQGSYALNSCVAVSNSLQFLVDRLPEHIYDIGICFIDTIDFKIQEKQSLTEQEIEKHPLMIEAREFLIGKSK